MCTHTKTKTLLFFGIFQYYFWQHANSRAGIIGVCYLHRDILIWASTMRLMLSRISIIFLHMAIDFKFDSEIPLRKNTRKHLGYNAPKICGMLFESNLASWYYSILSRQFSILRDHGCRPYRQISSYHSTISGRTVL